MYTTRYKKPISYDFDLIVIGSGAGGGVAAHVAANEGKKVAIIEAGMVGGECLTGSCVPTRALLESAKTLESVQSAHQFGIRPSSVRYNYQSVQTWKQTAIQATGGGENSAAFRSSGITVIKGHSQFISPWTVSVGLRRYSARAFLIASGSSAIIPNIPGLSETGYITYKEAANLTVVPKSIFIIGGGATAYEYAHIFSAFGGRVHVAESGPHLLPKDDPEIGDVAAAALESRGVRVHTASRVIQVSGKTGRKVVTFEQHGQQHRVAVEEIMIASGKSPNIDLGLENTGVYFTDDGIRVNRHMQTNKKHIFAVGDVTGKYMTTAAAMQESKIAAHNLYHRKKVVMNYSAVPQVIDGLPEIATVGTSERELKLTGVPYQTAIAPIGILGQAITTNYTAGFVKITATHTGIVLGASIVAPQAGEMVSLLSFAIQQRHFACDLANLIYPFPSWSEAIRIAAGNIRCI